MDKNKEYCEELLAIAELNDVLRGIVRNEGTILLIERNEKERFYTITWRRSETSKSLPGELDLIVVHVNSYF